MRLKKLFSAFLLVLASALAQADSMPAPGNPAPAFALPDQNGKVRSLDHWQGKWLVLYFYPKDDTPGCTTEAQHFRDRSAALKALNAEVAGVSLDDVASHRAFAEKHALNFSLLSDRDGAVARQYGVLNNLGVMKFARRVTFVINPEGRLARSYPDVDASRHAEQVLADLRQIASR